VASAAWAQSDDEGSAPAANVPADRGAVGSAGQAPGGAGVPAAPGGGAVPSAPPAGRADGGGSATAPAPESGDEPGFGGGEPYARDPYEPAPDVDGGATGTDDPYAVDPYQTDPYDDGD